MSIVSVKRNLGQTEIVHYVIVDNSGIEIRCTLEDFAARVSALIRTRVLTAGRLARLSDDKLGALIDQSVKESFDAGVFWLKESTAKT